MTSNKSARDVERRNEVFADKISTKITQEIPVEDNPYITQKVVHQGYDLLELMQKCRYTQVLFLLFKAELPSAEEEDLLQQLMIALINPGPRSAACRAAMNAGVGKTDPSHILPIGLMLLGGEHEGSVEVEQAMRFFRKQHKRPIDECEEKNTVGFGRVYGGIDVMAFKLLTALNNSPGAGAVLKWCQALAELQYSAGFGILKTGLAAAVFCDLGFQPRVGAALFQLLGAPGVLAHGLEYANKPLTSMPFVKDSDYEIQEHVIKK